VLIVPRDVWSETMAHFRRCGSGRRECVAYWTGPIGDPDVVDAAVHPVHRASAGSYELDDHWLHEFWVGLGRAQRSVRVQVHTHAYEAFHSGTDDLWPIVHVPGFVSVVIPNFAMEFSAEDLYVAQIDEGGRWKRVELAQVLKGIASSSLKR
jgi:hypothetical protein